LLVIDLIILFSWQKFTGEESNRMCNTVCVSLATHSTESVIRSIGFDNTGTSRIIVAQDRVRQNGSFEGIKRQLGGSRPFKFDILFEESREWSADLGIVLDKATIKVG
ncbi:hypothetical protein MUCCIDRAFT_119704, partial [Mucor lusitanicus CBS 277.49]